LKILFVLPEYYPHSGGGISTYYLHYIKTLKNRVNEICVIVGSGYTQSDDNFNVDGIKIEYLRPEIYQAYKSKFSKFDLMPEYRNNIAAAWAMWEQSKEGKGYDLVECTDFGLGFIPWLINHKIPVVTRLHGSSGQIDLFEKGNKIGITADLFRQAELLLLKKSDVLITHSTSNKIYWKNIFPEKDIAIIYPIFSVDKASLPLNQKEDYGIVCGRIQHWKGPDILCKALSELKKNIIVKWYGKDMPFDQKINKTTQLRIDYPEIWDKLVVHQKALPHDQIMEIQRRAKFAIIPSIWDMFNFTALEYIYAGTVVICSDGAGVSELIDNGVNGFKYSSNDPHELASCIEQLLKLNENEYNTIIKNAYKTLSEKLDYTKILDENIRLYKYALLLKQNLTTNLFLSEIFKPTGTKYSIEVALNNLSLKILIKHISNRIRKRILWVQ